MDRKGYIQIVSEQIRCKKALPLVTKELEDHMEDQKTDFMADGMTEQEAEEAAVMEMGDPVEVGVQMDGIHKPKMPWGMIALIVAVSAIGYVIQSSLASVQEFAASDNLWYYALGIGVMIGVCFLDYTWIAKNAGKLELAMFFGIALMMLWCGNMVNGRLDVIYIAGMNFTVSLLVYLFVPLYCAVLYTYRGEGYGAIVKSVLLMAPPLLIVKFIPSIYTGFTLILIFIVILSVAVCRGWFKVSKMGIMSGIILFISAAPVFIATWVYAFGKDYQRMRLQTLLEPSESEIAYQIQMLKELLGGSRLVGGNQISAKEFMKLPVSQDYVLTYVISYYGILAAIMIVAILLFLIIHLMRKTLKQKNQLGMLMGVGCAMVLIIQIFFYILKNTGLNVFVGNYCPILNRGGTGTIVTYALLGLMLSICRYQNVLPEHVNVTKEATKTGSLLSQK